MKIAVTGAAGHIGGGLVRALLAEGHAVRALVHQNRQTLEGLPIEFFQADVRDPVSLQRAFAGIEVVYHLAARISVSMRDWPQIASINVTGTQNVVDTCLHSGVRRLVHFSSIEAIVLEPPDRPVEESRPRVDPQSRTHSPYARSKSAGEQVVRHGIEHGLDAIILNPTGIVGPHDYAPSFLGRVLVSLANGKPRILVPGGFDWVDVRDVAQAAIRAAAQAPCGSQYILSGHWVSLRDLAAMVKAVASVRVRWWVCPFGLAYAGLPLVAAFARLTGKPSIYTKASLDAVRSNRSILHQRAAGDLGYQPRPFSETIVDTLRWFEATGRLAYPLKSVETPL